jgi:3-oxoadipate enol-lactonase
MEAMRTIYVDGAPRIAADVMGEGPLVLFLHGIGGNRTNWHPQLPAIASAFTACAWDARGYGLSDDYEGDLDFADFSDDICRLLDSFGVEKAHVCGLSFGGRVAQDFYPRHPDRVATLTLCDTFAGEDPDDPRSGRSQSPEEFVEARIRPFLNGATPAEQAPLSVAKLMSANRPDEAFARAVAASAELHVESYIKTVKASASYNRVETLKTIAVPTLLIFGEEDPLTPPAIGHYMQDHIADASLVLIEGAGHMSNLERPEAFNRALLDFLTAHAGLADSPSIE